MDQQISRSTGLLDLPNETLIYIFEFLSFEEVAKFRIICKRIDEICQKILNCGFQRAALLHAATYKRIKALLPRRESERRNHALARHADILTSVETRISMLSMTYSKYMDLNMCCFIPGRVLDEIFRILRLTTRTWIPLRPLEILQEFRDISSMAIEHFDEKIAIEFKKTIEINSYSKVHAGIAGCRGSGTAISINDMNDYRRSRSHILNTSVMSPTENLKSLPCDYVLYKPGDYPEMQRKSMRPQRKMGMRILHHRITALQRKSVQQKKHLTFFVRKVNCMTTQMAALKRRLDELDSKNQELIGTIRQYSLEDTQAEAGRTSGSPESTKSKELSPNKEKLSETQNVIDQRPRSSEITETNVKDKSMREFKLIRKALKRHFKKTLISNDEESNLNNDIVNKKPKI